MKNFIILILLTFSVISYSKAEIHKCELINANQTGFFQNHGQLEYTDRKNDDSVYYYYSSQNMSIYFMLDKVSFILRRSNYIENYLTINENIILEDSIMRIDLLFLDNQMNTLLEAEGKLRAKMNYYLHNFEGTNLPTWAKLIYKNIYKSIDIQFELVNKNLVLSVLTKDPDNLEDIKFQIKGCDNIIFDSLGSIILETKLGDLRFISSNLKSQSNNTFSINYCKGFDEVHTVQLCFKKGDILNSTHEISWASFIGGSNYDAIKALCFDEDNNIYLAGYSSSDNFPTTAGVIQESHAGSGDAIIMKLSQAGDLIWSTFLGGFGMDIPMSIVYSMRRKLLISGETRSNNLPVTSNPFQPYYKGGTSDALFFVLSKDGELEYLTYYGSSAYDVFGTIKEDSFGNIWLFGNTYGITFPITNNAFQSYNKGYYDAVLVKFDSTYNRVFSTYFGAEHDDFGQFINIDNNNDIIITGYTSSRYLPTNNDSYKRNLSGASDCYLAKFDNSGKLIWCSYFGGSKDDVSSNIVTDNQNSIYLRGVTNSLDLPVTSNAFQKKNGGQTDIFLVKFAPDGDLLWCTYFGGNQEDGPLGFDIHGGGLEINKSYTKLIMSGRTKSNDLFVSDDAYQKNLKGKFDAIIYEFDINGQPIWGSYLGGSSDDIGYWASYDINENLFVAGKTLSSDFPSKNPKFQTRYFGEYEGFITKFSRNEVSPKDSCLSVIDYPNFLNVKDLHIIGNSYKMDSVIRLTDIRPYQVGAVWHSKKVNIAEGFSTKFAFKLSQGNNNDCIDNSLQGADGLAFVIQNSSITSLGWSGGGLGYDGIPNSLAVEFDTFNNDSTQIENLFDPNGNHIAIQSCGSIPNTAKHNKECNIAINPNIFPLRSDGTIYYSKIDYHIKDNKFIVFLDTLPIFRFKVIELDNFDISKKIKLEQNKLAFVGFTAATGCAVENHDLLHWDFCTIAKNISDVNFEYPENMELSFDVIPNPVQDEINIKLNSISSQILELELFNQLGQRIYKEIIKADPQQIIRLKFDVNEVPAGFYICKVSSSTQSKVKKFIITK